MLKYQTFITRRLNDDVADNEEMAKAVFDALRRFNNLDWGKVPEEDKEANNADLRNRDGHVLARYETPKGDIYLNLVFDEPSINSDAVTIMYCEEY